MEYGESTSSSSSIAVTPRKWPASVLSGDSRASGNHTASDHEYQEAESESKEGRERKGEGGGSPKKKTEQDTKGKQTNRNTEFVGTKTEIGSSTSPVHLNFVGENKKETKQLWKSKSVH